MKKTTINFIIWYFTRYNKKLYIDYDILFEVLYFYNAELKKVITFLEELEKTFDTDYIYRYYFKPYFTKIYYGNKTDSFDLTGFLDFSVKDYKCFLEDIKNEIY